jgi:hypothetical protein
MRRHRTAFSRRFAPARTSMTAFGHSRGTADAVIAPTAFWPIRVGLKGAYPESPILIERQNSENTRPMVSVMGKERTQESPATLGDVLYARSKALAAE